MPARDVMKAKVYASSSHDVKSAMRNTAPALKPSHQLLPLAINTITKIPSFAPMLQSVVPWSLDENLSTIPTPEVVTSSFVR